MTALNEIMRKRGVEPDDWYNTCHQAENGTPRWGRIRKAMKIYSPPAWGNGKSNFAIVGVEINTWRKTIEVSFLKGSVPYAQNLFWALLADRDVRRLISEYQKTTRREKYRIWSKCGVSGKEDIFMTIGREIGGFASTRTKQLCHISGYGKLNEGFGDENCQMFVGDFVELAVYLGLTDDMNVKSLRKRARVKYILPKLSEEIEDFETTVSKIL